MQNEARLTIEDPYERLSLGLMTASVEKPRSHCVIKYAYQVADEKRTFFPSSNLMELYGFTKEQSKKIHRCPTEDCKTIGTLGEVLYHMACSHGIKIAMIGKAIPYIKNDTRPLPTWKERMYSIVVKNLDLLVRG